MDNRSIQVARFVLAFSWVYHGLFPKLITVAPLEKALTATIGLSAQHSYLVTKTAGILEIAFGLVIFMFYQNRSVLQINIMALILLCLFTAIKMPVLLIEAFNPVTTNLALIGLSYILLRAQNKGKSFLLQKWVLMWKKLSQL